MVLTHKAVQLEILVKNRATGKRDHRTLLQSDPTPEQAFFRILNRDRSRLDTHPSDIAHDVYSVFVPGANWRAPRRLSRSAIAVPALDVSSASVSDAFRRDASENAARLVHRQDGSGQYDRRLI
jgi:hypothetical protein